MTLAATAAPLKRTPLHSLHLALGAKMVAFAGYEMPLQYPAGILNEHSTRARRPGFSTSRIWGSCGSPEETRSKRSKRSSRAICWR